MSSMKEKLVSWLFQTDALKVSPGDKPFWYTSGTIGPYYINTHFLYGNIQKANNLLELINSEKDSKSALSAKLLEIILNNYEEDPIFKELIINMCHFIKDNINLNEVDYISGGERRDWFFSIILANKLGKPHISIFKDFSIIATKDKQLEKLENLKGKKVLHIADLITEGSSYERAWIPVIEKLEGTMKWSVVVVDRLQGGANMLESKGVKPFAMIGIDKSLFERSFSLGLIEREQYNMICNYIDDPRGSMKKFLQDNPEFLKNALISDEKTKERAKLCLDKNIYDLNVSQYNQYI